MPERFMVGTDEKFGRLRRGVEAAEGKKYYRHIRRMRKILGSLSPEAAELIAYKNAKKIFR